MHNSVSLRIEGMYLAVISDLNCDWLRPQSVPQGEINSYYTFAMKFIHPDISWENFRLEYIKNGGDGIYAAWTLCYLEDSIPDIKNRLSKMGLDKRFNTQLGQCPIAENIQPQLMQLTTNQKDEDEMKIQADVLNKTIKHFS